MKKGFLKVVFTACVAFTTIFMYGRGVMGTPILVDDVSGSPGGSVTVHVTAGASGFTGVGSTDFKILYPTLYLNATAVSNGGHLSIFSSSINDGTGTITAGSISGSGDTVATGQSFFDIFFDIAPGAPSGVYTLDLTKADLTTATFPFPVIATEMVDGSITVNGAVVPEPTSVLLLGMGFLGIAGYMRKRLNKK